MTLAEVSLDIGSLLHHIELSPPETKVFIILHSVGAPLGTVVVEAESGRCHGRRILEAAIAQHGERLIRRLLADALETGAFAATGSIFGPRPATDRPTAPPPITVAICTRNRPADLDRALTSLWRSDHPDLDVLVVDNAPDDDSTLTLVRSQHPRARYVREPRPGLNQARNRAVRETARALIAFVDDDVTVSPDWARRASETMAREVGVAALLGLVLPAELATAAQVAFEQSGGLAKGFDRRWLRLRADERTAARFVNSGPLGIGANMTLRRSVFDETGLFDPALGAGTPTGGGDDLDIIFRILRARHTALYDPAIVVRHRHRQDEASIRTQVRQWCRGTLAYLMRTMRACPEERLAAARTTLGLILIYYPRRVFSAIVTGTPPLPLAWAEFRGAMEGPFKYLESARRASLQGPADDVPNRQPRSGSHGNLSPVRRVPYDLSLPLPDVLPGPDDSDRVLVDFTYRGAALGTVDIVSGGGPVTRARLVDAVAEQFWEVLVPASDRTPSSLFARFVATD